jgi:hypothetical protein
MFTYAFFIPAGVFDAPHHHIADTHLHVTSGELMLGDGTSFIKGDADRFPAGVVPVCASSLDPFRWGRRGHGADWNSNSAMEHAVLVLRTTVCDR